MMMSRNHGPGFRFHPTDEELIMYYLKKRVTRRKFHHDGIQERDVYSLDPRDLKVRDHWTRDHKWYFFSPRERKYLIGDRTNRSTKHGFWKTTGNDRKVSYNGENVAMIKSLVFHKRDPTDCTNWVMYEYKLRDEYLEQLGVVEDVFVLCVIFEKGGLGPRNGAQYGAPYREEDWDDVNDELENRGEDTHGVGALTQGYDVGSSSRTLPSDIDQFVNPVFLPTPVPGTMSVGAQLPLSYERGMFSHEVLSALPGHEWGQDIDVDQDVNCEPAIQANEENIYVNLEDLCRLEDFPGSGVGGHGNDFHANQEIPSDDYMELADCMNSSRPFEGSHDHNHVGPGQPTCGIPYPAFVSLQNLGAGISDITPSWNGLHHEPGEANRFIIDPLTGLSWFRSGHLPDSVSSELHGPYLDQHSPAFEGSVRFTARGSGGYEPFRQHPQFSVELGDENFGVNVPYSNQHLHVAGGPIGFGGQGLGENLWYWNPHHQFAQEPDGFVGQSFRENVASFHGPQFAEDLAGLGGHGSGENVQHLNQHHQPADGSIGFGGQEASMNGQMDHRFAGVGPAAPFGNVQPSESMPSGSTSLMTVISPNSQIRRFLG